MRVFLDKELAPFADDIDKQNDFPQMRVSATILGHITSFSLSSLSLSLFFIFLFFLLLQS